MPKTYTVKQVSQALGFSTNTVYKYLEEGRIKSTRLSSEGRFKIPESEVTRLLGNPPQPQPETTPLPHYPRITTLFELFISLTGLFLGLTNLFFTPAAYPVPSLLLLTGGLLSLIQNLISISPSRLARKLPVLFIILGLTSQLLFQFNRDSYPVVSLYISLIVAAFLLLIDIPVSSFSKFLASLFCLDILFIASFQFSIHNFPLIYPLAGGILTASVTLALFWFRRHNEKTFISLLILWSLPHLAMSALFLSRQEWINSVVLLVCGSFLLIFPFEKNLPPVSEFTRRQSQTAIVWLLGIITLGISLVYTIQSSYRKSILNETSSRANLASSLVKNYLDTAGQSLLNSQDKTAKALFFSAPAFRRVLILDSENQLVSSYPPETNPDFSAFDLNNVSKDKQSLFSDPVAIFTPVMVNGVYSGLTISEIDFVEIGNRLQKLLSSPAEKIFLVNSQGINLLNPVQIYNPAQSELNIQSQSAVSDLNWTVIYQRPYPEAFRTPLLISFAVFLFTVIFGLGALTTNTYLVSKP